MPKLNEQQQNPELWISCQHTWHFQIQIVHDQAQEPDYEIWKSDEYLNENEESNQYFVDGQKKTNFEDWRAI